MDIGEFQESKLELLTNTSDLTPAVTATWSFLLRNLPALGSPTPTNTLGSPLERENRARVEGGDEKDKDDQKEREENSMEKEESGEGINKGRGWENKKWRVVIGREGYMTDEELNIWAHTISYSLEDKAQYVPLLYLSF